MTTQEHPCPHGRYEGDPEAQAGYGQLMSAPISDCTCCGNYFYYIDSASYSPVEVEKTVWTPKNRCGTCGGGYVHEQRHVGKALAREIAQARHQESSRQRA